VSGAERGVFRQEPIAADHEDGPGKNAQAIEQVADASDAVHLELLALRVQANAHGAPLPEPNRARHRDLARPNTDHATVHSASRPQRYRRRWAMPLPSGAAAVPVGRGASLEPRGACEGFGKEAPAALEQRDARDAPYQQEKRKGQVPQEGI